MASPSYTFFNAIEELVNEVTKTVKGFRTGVSDIAVRDETGEVVRSYGIRNDR